MPTDLAAAEMAVSPALEPPVPATNLANGDAVADRIDVSDRPMVAARGIVNGVILSAAFWILLALTFYLLP